MDRPPAPAGPDEDPVPQSKRHPARRPQQRSAKPGHHTPAGRGPASAPTQPASPARQWLVRHSAGPLVVLHRMPTWLLPGVFAVLLLAGLALPFPAAGLLLLVIAAYLGWLLALSWPITSWGGRALRLLAVLMLLVMTVLRLTGRF